MDIRQLQYFSTIVEEGQITRAAKKLHMAQPPLSHQLKLLEEELGVKLIERSGKKLELTNAGKVLYKKAQKLIHQLEETIIEVKETDEGCRGTLSLGASKSCFSFFSERLPDFVKKYPLVSIQLREGDSFVIGEQIKNKEIDIGVTRLPMDLSEFSYLHLSKDPYVAVLHHKWVREMNLCSSTIRMEQLKGIPLLLLHRIKGSGQYELVVDECRRHGFEPNTICECPDVTMILSLVSKGMGATIIPKYSLLSFQTSNVQVLQIENTNIVAESALIWSKDRYLPKSAKNFIEMFEERVQLD
ncbi:LysR family transcriptional regulator [Heyndrickxia sporothermodurans]|uniref:LysR family transcriptional regulator n=1 Tax=Heyndrickxia sporothermodurans TaxID=46224 RepID=UPI000D3B71B5|nr:LysR family transcriptional regulator [Heyndrickxia sporothermodurans]PTY78497.1 LysR family transcriptional regulator [Heyndrickxia sporothermodurans]